MNLFKFLFVFLISISLIGCSYIKGAPTSLRKNDSEYSQAQSIPKLKTPKGYPELKYQDQYPIPTQQYPEDAKKIKLNPPE